MISISNIAWETEQDDDIKNILVDQNIPYIDVAHSKYFNSPSDLKKSDIEQIKKRWNQYGISIYGMQSLMYGTQDLNIFGSKNSQDKMLSHLNNVCYIAENLGARKLVFGSPRNRDRSKVPTTQVENIAINFFNQLGDIAKSHQVTICLEPNPTCYNSNFMTNSYETHHIVEKTNHSNIKMQLDIGAMILNSEPAFQTIEKIKNQIHHIHISEPNLAPLNINNSFHISAAQAISKLIPELPLTIEMLTSSKTSAPKEIIDAIAVIKNIYKR